MEEDMAKKAKKKLVCPECGIEITSAKCYSQAVQNCLVNEDGVAGQFDSAEVFGESQYECPECATDITHLIR